MIIALPSNGSNFDEHFGHCQNFTIFSIDCAKTGWATISGVGDTPNIVSDAYDIGHDKSTRIRLDKVPELAFDGGSIKILDSNWATTQWRKLIAKVKEEADTVLVAEDLDLVKWC